MYIFKKFVCNVFSHTCNPKFQKLSFFTPSFINALYSRNYESYTGPEKMTGPGELQHCEKLRWELNI